MHSSSPSLLNNLRFTHITVSLPWNHFLAPNALLQGIVGDVNLWTDHGGWLSSWGLTMFTLGFHTSRTILMRATEIPPGVSHERKSTSLCWTTNGTQLVSVVHPFTVHYGSWVVCYIAIHISCILDVTKKLQSMQTCDQLDSNVSYVCLQCSYLTGELVHLCSLLFQLPRYWTC